jgi:hypothetical protein
MSPYHALLFSHRLTFSAKSRTPLRLFFPIPFFLFLLCSCAALYKTSSHPPLSKQDVETVLSGIRGQESRVFSCYMNGQLTVKNWIWNSDFHILIVGTKEPYRIKIEVTHPWGHPVVHVLIDRTTLQVLSFQENRLYIGPFTAETLSEFFPGNFDIDLIWAVLRGHPKLLEYQRAISLGSDQVSLLDDKEDVVEIIDIRADNPLPRQVSYPQQNITMVFSDVQENQGIRYARKIKVKNTKKKGSLVVENKEIGFNRTFPEQIFFIEKPPLFETYYLDDRQQSMFNDQ